MTKEQLDFLMNEGLLVDLLAQRVVEKLLRKQREALVVFTGATTGAGDALESMAALKKEGFRFWVLVSRSASGNLDLDRIRSVLEPEELWIGAPDSGEHGLSIRFDTIIVPTATIYTASQVALCMTSTPAASVVLDGLMRGKRVIIATDGCCPDNPSRVEKGFRMNGAVKETLRGHLETIQSYGARLTSAKNLARAVTEELRLSLAAPAAEKKAPANARPAGTPAGGAKELRVDSHIVSGNHVRSCPPGGTLLVPANALVTQMAQDEARIRMVQIRRQA